MTETNNKQKDRKGQAPNETMVERRIELGDLMRRSREDSGYTIERVATATRISYPFIEALENGQLQKLPAEAFSRGFIRNLCKVYNEDPKPMLAAFEEALKGDQKIRSNYADSLQPNIQQKRVLFPSIGLTRRVLFSKPIQRLKSAPYPVFFTAFAILLISLLAAWFALREGMISHASLESNPIWQDLNGGAVDSDVPVEDFPRDVPGATNNGLEMNGISLVEDVEELDVVKELEKSALAAEGNWIELHVKKRIQVMIDKDGQGWSNETLEPESYQYRFQDVLQVVLGNSDSVDITFNGRPLVQGGQGGQGRRLTFRSDGFDEMVLR